MTIKTYIIKFEKPPENDDRWSFWHAKMYGLSKETLRGRLKVSNRENLGIIVETDLTPDEIKRRLKEQAEYVVVEIILFKNWTHLPPPPQKGRKGYPLG